MTLRKKAEPKLSNGFQVEIAIPSLFDREARKVGEFIIVCKLYLKIKIRKTTVKEYVQWVLMYVQRESADM